MHIGKINIMIYFKRKTGSPILEISNGLQLPDVVIVPTQIIVNVKLKILEFTWGFYVSPTIYLAGNVHIEDGIKGFMLFRFNFTEQTTPNFQQSLDIFDWTDGGEISQSQIALDFFGSQPDPTTEDEDIIYDNWDGMIYNP